jgi:tRNA modification GTPase
VSDTAVSLLTPPGTGAIATVEVRGPRAWELARKLFSPAGKPLPESLEINRFWFGTLGSDEVVLAATAKDAVEVHCHGGRRVVRWVIEQFTSRGCIEAIRTPGPSGQGFELLQRAPTLRTASILLDQLNGAFANEVRRILALLETDPRGAAFSLHRLAELGNSVGRHLIEPWKVVIAGPPNVGKSSLINALAGYQRSVVSEVAGTTRDAVSVRTAFDGWPVDLIDTAGLRETEGLEADGIARARDEMVSADLVLWVLDVTVTGWELPTDASLLHVVINKCDEPIHSGLGARDVLGWPHISARTGEGIAQLAAQIIERLVLKPPSAGDAMPYTTKLCEQVGSARDSALQYDWGATKHHLRAALTHSEDEV